MIPVDKNLHGAIFPVKYGFCAECGCNVHEKCQGKIEVQCEKTQQRLGKVERPKTSQSQGAKPK